MDQGMHHASGEMNTQKEMTGIDLMNQQSIHRHVLIPGVLVMMEIIMLIMIIIFDGHMNRGSHVSTS